MFDVAPTELLLVAVVALVVIGPKDLPRAMRVVGQWVGRARGMARHFRSGIDEMIRQSELEEMEKKWRDENERIMREFPTITDPVALPDHSEPAAPPALIDSSEPQPVMLPADSPVESPDLANWQAAPEPTAEPEAAEPHSALDDAPAAPAATSAEEQLSLLPPDPAAPQPKGGGKPQP
jgi:sec-independent protein translocase protein TatB